MLPPDWSESDRWIYSRAVIWRRVPLMWVTAQLLMGRRNGVRFQSLKSLLPEGRCRACTTFLISWEKQWERQREGGGEKEWKKKKSMARWFKPGVILASLHFRAFTLEKHPFSNTQTKKKHSARLPVCLGKTSGCVHSLQDKKNLVIQSEVEKCHRVMVPYPGPSQGWV